MLNAYAEDMTRNLLRNIRLVHVKREAGNETDSRALRVAQQHLPARHRHHLKFPKLEEIFVISEPSTSEASQAYTLSAPALAAIRLRRPVPAPRSSTIRPPSWMMRVIMRWFGEMVRSPCWLDWIG